MTKMTWAAVPLAVLLCIPATTLSAQPPSAPPIVVTASPRAVALAEWSTRVGQGIESKMRFPHKLGQANAGDRLVEVAFVTDDNGGPEQVTVVTKSGDQRTDRAAVRAISRMDTLAPLPEGMERNQAFRAQLLYVDSSTDRRHIERRADALRAKARASNSWYTSQDQVASRPILLTAALR